MINRPTRINKSKYYRTLFSEHKTNYRETREVVGSLINVEIKSNERGTSLNINNQIEPTLKTMFLRNC